MGTDSDDIALPSPPPPRPDARRQAIATALRKFDGVEQPPSGVPEARRRWRGWSVMNRRPAGALFAAAVIAVVGIPAVQIALRERPSEIAAELPKPAVDREAEQQDSTPQPRERAADSAPSVPEPSPDLSAPSPPSTGEERRTATAEPARRQDAIAASPAVSTAPATPPAAAPAPPPPPPAEPEAKAEAEAYDNIVVTGSRVDRQNLGSASPLAVIDPTRDFLSRLAAAFRANDRRAVIRLVGYPLRVHFGGESRTYGSARDVARDYDRIFTPAVRQTALALGPDDLTSRDGGRLKGQGGLWFGCGRKSCGSSNAIRIREITP